MLLVGERVKLGERANGDRVKLGERAKGDTRRAKVLAFATVAMSGDVSFALLLDIDETFCLLAPKLAVGAASALGQIMLFDL